MGDLLRDLALRGFSPAFPSLVRSYPSHAGGDRTEALSVRRTGAKANTSGHNTALLAALPSLGWTRTRAGLYDRGGDYVHLLGYRLSARASWREKDGCELTVVLPSGGAP
jgi:hypothetical protein